MPIPMREAERAPGNVSWAGFPCGKMALIAGITIYGSIFFYTVQIQAASGLTELGLTSPSRIGFLTSLASIGVPLGTFVYSRVAKCGVQRLLLAEFLLLAAGFMLMGRAGSVAGFLAGCAINQLGAGMLLPTLLVWAMSILKFEFRGRGTGLWQSAFALGQWLSPLVVTVFALRAGGVMEAFQLLSLVAAAGVVVITVTFLVAVKPAHV